VAKGEGGGAVNVLVLNCGSSSVKFQIVATDVDLIARDGDRRLAYGEIERVGSLALIRLQAEGGPRHVEDAPVRDHRAAVDRILRWIVSPDAGIPGIGSLADVHAVGHRVVHGGERFKRSARIDADVVAGIEECIELAPLHNPANLRGIRAATEILGPFVPQVAVFDTAFHAGMPETSYLYGIPYSLYRRHRIRRYGFHGTSHRYVAYRYRKLRGIERSAVNLITLHLGQGCSACAIRGGVSIDTSMGFTPVEGLLMGTRSGDVDPSILEFLAHKEGMDLPEIGSLLNKQSGLLGLSGLTGDMRDLLAEERENGDRRAHLAIEIFCLRIRKYVGAYHAAYPGTEAIVFTGGIGENSPAIRERVATGLAHVGLTLDASRNAALAPGDTGPISADGAALAAWVIPTNEELLIARDTVRVVADLPRRW
jgi:acetate kinase